MIARKPAFLLREVSAGPRILPWFIGGGKTFCMPLIRLSLIAGSSHPKINPAIAMMAITMGKMAVMRLNASPAAKFMTQSLLNLVQKACRDLMSFSTACIGSEVICCSVCGSFVWVAMIFLSYYALSFFAGIAGKLPGPIMNFNSYIGIV